MRLLILAAAAAVALATPASASDGVIYEPGGECNGAVDHGCHVNHPDGPYSCTAWFDSHGLLSGDLECILKWSP